MRKVVTFVLGMLVAPTAVVGSCKSSPPGNAGDGIPDGDYASDVPRLSAPIIMDAPCFIEIDSPPLLPRTHVPIGTPVTYSSNPPSSGPHYPIWADFIEYTIPVDRRYYVHDLEHGAIVFLYQCMPPADCSQYQQAFEGIVKGMPDDPLCNEQEGERVRTVITPDPLIANPVAAAAWGWTYVADCIDLPSLQAFAQLHYGQGPEQLCTPGQQSF